MGILDRLLALLFHGEEERLKRIAFDHEQRQLMESHYDQKGTLWDRHGREVSNDGEAAAS